MKIKDLLIKDLLKINLDYDIDTVVDLDKNPDEKALKEGLDNFVLTNSLGKHLYDFLDEYNGGTMQSGVWLSGFYGSGKSYFAQIIGLLLQNKNILGTPMRDRFSMKLDGLPNEELLRIELGNLNRYNNKVVSFDASKHNNVNGLPFMIFSAFLRSLGMPDTQEGMIEYDFLMSGKHSEFLEAIESISGKSWSEVIKNNDEIIDFFDPALMKMGYNQSQIGRLLDKATQTREEYDAARLKQDLARYLDQNPDTRIVFFIDEVSEAITQKKIRLDDLEGVAEALASLGRKVWTVAIAQQRLDDVIKSENIQLNSLTKVRDRFRTKIVIEADEVDTIIRHRLLDKEESSRTVLKEYFTENNGIIADVTNIGVPSLKKTEDVNTYIDYYPFYQHQFRLLQYFLFGSKDLVQTRVGNRGMIISAFDVLKKEVKNAVADHYHVSANQLCNQADDSVEESISHRYRQAKDTLSNQNYEFVDGEKLLQTINFLTKSGVPTTISNITKSYLNRPENYHEILSEVKKALDILRKNQIVIVAGEQYRITNEAEQRILDEMRRMDVPSWEIIQDVNNVLRKRDIVRLASNLNINGINIPYKVATIDGEVYVNPNENYLSVIFSDLLNSKGIEDLQFVEDIRQETADTKGRMTLIPTIKYRNEIKELATELRRLKYISEKTNLTDDEKQIVKSLCSERDVKEVRFQELIEKSFVEGLAIYCFNKYQLSTSSVKNIIVELQEKMFENIFTKRLSAEMPDSLAQGVFGKQPGQLHNYFGTSSEFKFFDTSGAFIGTNLSVVAEILALTTSFISGKELENKLAGPPTRYSHGTIITTLAALFRGDKLIVKFGGDEYTSWRQPGAIEAFKTARNFDKASFKAVSQSLTYKQKRDIVDILKEDCDFAKNAKVEYKLSYQLNDFDIINALRDLSVKMISIINARIEGDDDYRRMFPMSIAARQVFQQYQMKVTEGNFMQTARNFLISSNTDDYINAVERVNKDVKFIEEKMSDIRKMVAYIDEVEDQFEKAHGSKVSIEAKIIHFRQCYERDIVAHYTAMRNDCQEMRDAFILAFKKAADKAMKSYNDLLVKVDSFKENLSQYPREWNSNIWTEVDRLSVRIKPYTDISTTFDNYSVKSLRSRMDLRDVCTANDNVQTYEVKLLSLESQIVTTEPGNGDNSGGLGSSTSKSGSSSGSGNSGGSKPTPKTHKLKSQIPHGDISVEDYRQWLTKQLALLSSFKSIDLINLED